MSRSLQSIRSFSSKLLRTTSLKRTYASTTTPIATHQSIANLLNESIAAGNHTVTAVQCTVLPLQSGIISPALASIATTVGLGEEDAKLGLSSLIVAAVSVLVPEKTVKIQALVELVVKAKDFDEIQHVGVPERK